MTDIMHESDFRDYEPRHAGPRTIDSTFQHTTPQHRGDDK